MKKLTLSLAAVAAMGTFAVAGGDIAPVEPAPVAVAPVVDSGFYAGIAYGLITSDSDITSLTPAPDKKDVGDSYHSVMLQAGYKVNQYFAVEGRYWWGVGSNSYLGSELSSTGALGNSDTSVEAYGIYVKPIYPVTDALDIYALAGFASSAINDYATAGGRKFDVDASGFSWGLGASYDVTDSISVFVDYVDFDSQSEIVTPGVTATTDLASWNFGVNYKF